MAVSLQVRKLMDHIAKGKQTSLAAYSGGTDMWTIIDAAADETFENRMVGTNRTAADNAVEAGGSWNIAALRQFMQDLRSYCVTDLAMASPYVDNAVEAWGWRVPYHAAECYYEAIGGRLLPQNVFPKGTYTTGDLSATGMHKFGRLTGTAGASTYASTDGAIDTDKLVGAVIVAHSVEADCADSSLKVDPVKQDGVSKITAGLTLEPSESLDGHVIVGAEAITGRNSATVLTCAATGQFTVGDWVLLWEVADGDTSQREAAQVKTIVANTSLEFESAMVNTFSSSGYIYPMYTNISLKSGTIANGKHVDFYALPDRIIAL